MQPLAKLALPLVATTALITHPIAATEAATDVGAEVQAALDSWAADGPGGAIVLIGDSGGDLVAAAGHADADGTALTPTDELRVGSLTKSFVAVVALQLVDEGALGLDDLVTDHMPELTVAEGVTVRHLLGHRSGIPEHTDRELAPAVLADLSREWTSEEVVALVADQDRDFDPGARFAYSNTNYLIAAMLIERLTRTTLAEQLDERIIEPLGLDGTYLAPTASREPVTGFSNNLPGGNSDASPYLALETAAGGAGALVSTASDLATFLRALAAGELMSDESYTAMTAGLAADGTGLGIFAGTTETAISNAGAIPGFTAYMEHDPVSGRTFILLANDDTHSVEPLGATLERLARTM